MIFEIRLQLVTCSHSAMENGTQAADPNCLFLIVTLTKGCSGLIISASTSSASKSVTSRTLSILPVRHILDLKLSLKSLIEWVELFIRSVVELSELDTLEPHARDSCVSKILKLV